MKTFFKSVFKQTSQEVPVLNVQTEVISENRTIIDDIHDEFYKAGDQLLQDAINLINNAPQYNLDKINTLKALGFSQAQEVSIAEPTLKNVELSKEQIELVNYYKEHYPNQRFITEDKIQEICHKYNLVYGEVSRFKGFVPNSQLELIANFTLKPAEKHTLICRQRNNGEIFYIENAVILEKGAYKHIFKVGETDSLKHAFQKSADWDHFYSNDAKNLFGLRYKGSIDFTVENDTLMICAPVKDMDISGYELIDGYKLEKPHIPDPVVIQKVKGGGLILAAWGDEASDENVKL